MRTRTRTEQHQVSPSHTHYKLIDELCSYAKNIYNKALYEQRQAYFQFNKFISYPDLYTIMKQEEAFKQLPSVLAQQVLRQVTTNCTSFTKASISYTEDNSRFLGRPKLPKYKRKNGRFKLEFTSRAFRLKGDTIYFHKVMQGLTVKTKQTDIVNIQIVPKNNIYIINVIYNKEIPEPNITNLKYAAGIDLGINNFSTITVWNNATKPIIIYGKGLKSYNKFFNKQLSKLQAEAKTRNDEYITKKIKNLIQKRNNFMQTFMHKASRLTVEYLKQNQVRYVVIGHNTNWKQESKLSKKVNQTFIQIPYNQYISYVKYKAEEAGIQVIEKEESYTSGTSFLDNELPVRDNYNKSRRIHRGLFRSNTGALINADVNASYQIQKKAFQKLVIDQEAFTRAELHNKLVPTIIKVA